MKRTRSATRSYRTIKNAFIKEFFVKNSTRSSKPSYVLKKEFYKVRRKNNSIKLKGSIYLASIRADSNGFYTFYEKKGGADAAFRHGAFSHLKPIASVYEFNPNTDEIKIREVSPRNCLLKITKLSQKKALETDDVHYRRKLVGVITQYINKVVNFASMKITIPVDIRESKKRPKRITHKLVQKVYNLGDIDLGALIRECSFEKVSHYKRIRILLAVANQIKMLHDGVPSYGPVMHLDIKPDNICIDKSLSKVNLIDFDSSTPIDYYKSQIKAGMTPRLCHTKQYAAPELHAKNPQLASDIFSFGCVIAELFSWDIGILSDERVSKENYKQRYDALSKRLDFLGMKPLLNKGIIGLIKNMTQPDYKKRKSIIEVIGKLNTLLKYTEKGLMPSPIKIDSTHLEEPIITKTKSLS